MAKIRKISSDFWTDTRVDTLDPIEKLLYIYLFTNDKSWRSWATEITVKKIGYETWIDRDMVLKILWRFEQIWKVKYIGWYILVKNFIKYHFDWSTSPDTWGKNNQIKAIVANIRSLPQEIIDECVVYIDVFRDICDRENIKYKPLGSPLEAPMEGIVPSTFTSTFASTSTYALGGDKNPQPLQQTLEEKINEYRTTYPASMIQSFLLYRTEKNSKWKERWQCEKFFEVGKRLRTRKLKDDKRSKKDPVESAASRAVRIEQQVQAQKSLTPKYTWNAITNLQRSIEQWESDRGGDID